MTNQEFIKNCLRTNTGIKVNINEGNEDLLHSMLGLCTETGELQDTLKKHLFYGQKLDTANIREECGDVLWYMSILLEWCGYSYEEVMEEVIEKLKIRYPDKFSVEHAKSRMDKSSTEPPNSSPH